jgi:hypothetical protein
VKVKASWIYLVFHINSRFQSDWIYSLWVSDDYQRKTTESTTSCNNIVLRARVLTKNIPSDEKRLKFGHNVPQVITTLWRIKSWKVKSIDSQHYNIFSSPEDNLRNESKYSYIVHLVCKCIFILHNHLPRVLKLISALLMAPCWVK